VGAAAGGIALAAGGYPAMGLLLGALLLAAGAALRTGGTWRTIPA
jgi:hypothetical protein